MASNLLWQQPKLDENVMRRKLLRMDTKKLIKHCKSQKIAYYGKRRDIVNRLIANEKYNTSKRNKSSKKYKTKKNLLTQKKKSKRNALNLKKTKKCTRNKKKAAISPIHIAQSSTETIKTTKFGIKTSKKKKKKKKNKFNNDIKRMDHILGTYYINMGRNDYFTYYNKNKMGKFEMYCKQNGYNVNNMKNDILGDFEYCNLVSFDDKFPLNESEILKYNKYERNKQIYYILKYCYNNNKPPIYQKETAKIISYSQLKIVINGYLRIMQKYFGLIIPYQINNICQNYSFLDVSDLNNMNISIAFNDDMVRRVNAIYMKQCHGVFGNMYSMDIRILTFGYFNNWPQFLQYLVDCYIRKMVQKKKNPFNEESIITYLQSLEWMKKINKINTSIFKHFVSNLSSYIHSIISPMRIDAYFNRNINDDIYAIFYYLITAIKFVNNLVDENDNITPFQFDFCILFKEMKQVTQPLLFSDYLDDINNTDNESESDLSDNDSDIEYDYNALIPKYKKKKAPKQYIAGKLDIVGNVKYRLQATKCKFVTTNIDTNFHENSDFENGLLTDFENKTYRKFTKQIGLNASDNSYQFYPKNRRFIGVVDRRKWIKNGERMVNGRSGSLIPDELIMFEPPKYKKCNELAMDKKYNKPLPETYHNKSVECLIPGAGFNDIINDNFNDSKQENNNNNELTGDVFETINCISKLNGAMMVFSFHIESNHQIKCYLFYGTGCYRLYPNDIQNILSLAFMRDFKNNAYFLHDSVIKKKINQIKITDRYFEYFYETMTNKKFKH